MVDTLRRRESNGLVARCETVASTGRTFRLAVSRAYATRRGRRRVYWSLELASFGDGGGGIRSEQAGTFEFCETARLRNGCEIKVPESFPLVSQAIRGKAVFGIKDFKPIWWPVDAVRGINWTDYFSSSNCLMITGTY